MAFILLLLAACASDGAAPRGVDEDPRVGAVDAHAETTQTERLVVAPTKAPTPSPPPRPTPSPTPNAALNVAITGLSTGQIVSGWIVVEATITATDAVAKVDFIVDGTLVRTEEAEPYSLGGDGGSGILYGYDTNQLANGNHSLKAVATDINGLTAAADVAFSIQNSPIPTSPDPAPRRVVAVATAAAFERAIATARAGDEIRLADGVYHLSDTISTRASGTEDDPIKVIGSRQAILDRGTTTTGAGFVIEGHNYWILDGFTLRNSHNGIWLEDADYNVIRDVELHSIGTVGIAMNTWSSYNVVDGAYLHGLGTSKPAYGEGIYIGTWVADWDDRTDGQPDDSSYNVVKNSKIGPNVTAQGVDIKTGSNHNQILNNEFDGAGLAGPDFNHNTEPVIVGGNDNLIEGNYVHHPYQHGIVLEGADWAGYPGYGQRNTVRNNVVDMTQAVDKTGYAFFQEGGARSNNVSASSNTVIGTNRIANFPLTP